MVTTIFE